MAKKPKIILFRCNVFNPIGLTDVIVCIEFIGMDLESNQCDKIGLFFKDLCDNDFIKSSKYQCDFKVNVKVSV